MSGKNSKVDWVFEKDQKWRKEFRKLRGIILGCGLAEELKWGQACYTFEGKNIVLIHGFKEYCAVLFFKGAILKDGKGILVQQTEHVQAGRQVRFKSVGEIAALEPVLKAYIREAIGVEKAGLKIEHKKTSEFKVAEEFQRKLDRVPGLKAAFGALTPGRQRGYLLYFAGAKRAETREGRVEKCLGQILEGKGMDD